MNKAPPLCLFVYRTERLPHNTMTMKKTIITGALIAVFAVAAPAVVPASAQAQSAEQNNQAQMQQEMRQQMIQLLMQMIERLQERIAEVKEEQGITEPAPDPSEGSNVDVNFERSTVYEGGNTPVNLKITGDTNNVAYMSFRLSCRADVSAAFPRDGVGSCDNEGSKLRVNHSGLFDKTYRLDVSEASSRSTLKLTFLIYDEDGNVLSRDTDSITVKEEPNEDAYIQVEEPDGGEKYSMGDSLTAEWKAPDLDTVNVYLHHEDGGMCHIATRPADEGSYTFTLTPDRCTNSQEVETGDYRVAVLDDLDDDRVAPEHEDRGGYFTVSRGGHSSVHDIYDISVTSPIEGDLWENGEHHTIRWEQTFQINEKVDIYYVDHRAGPSRGLIASGVNADDGQYDWKVDVSKPSTAENRHYQIEIWEAGTDISDQVSEVPGMHGYVDEDAEGPLETSESFGIIILD